MEMFVQLEPRERERERGQVLKDEPGVRVKTDIPGSYHLMDNEKG